MKQMFYNFDTHKEVNPLESIDSFFINPHMPEGYKQLKIEEKIKDIDDGEIIFYQSMPSILFPISILKLNRCMVKWSDDMSGFKLVQDRLTVYCSLTLQPNIIRINTVLWR